MGEELDLLVIGAGACGLCAAIAAHDAGATVAIIEAMDRPGGNSALSTGSIPAAGTRFQKAAGIHDDPERMAADMLALSHGDTEDAALVHRLAQVSAQTVEWLVDTVGVRLELITAYRHVGHGLNRLHAPVSRRGQDLVDDLLAAVSSRGISLALGNRADSLIVEDGAVVGAMVDSGRGAEPVRAGKTLLALNGFAANRTLLRRFCPEIAEAEYFGARGSNGEAVLWGEALGADLLNMGAYQGYAAVAYPQGSLLTWTTIEKGGILVGADGRRFGDESLGYSGFARVVLGQSGPVFALFDQRIFDIAVAEEEFAELWRYGGLKTSPTLDGLAAAAGLDASALARTVGNYNRAALGELADPCGRRDFGGAPLMGPFHLARVTPGLFHTQGGLRVDGEGRVQKPNGAVIPNLFAGGGAAAGVSGRTGGGGYASGNGLLSAVSLGRLAGLAAAAERAPS